MNLLLKTKNAFLILVIAVTISILIFFTVFFTKTDSFLLLNRFHTNSLDIFFTYFTFLGDGLFSVLLAFIFFIFKRKALAVQLFISFIVSGVLVQVLKRIFELPRPKAFFEPGFYHRFIEGVTHAGLNSFPSGHTTSAFSIAMICSLYTKNKWLQLFYFIIALLVGYSRVYLGQHFVADLFLGAVIGIATAILVYRFVKVPFTRQRCPSRKRRQLSVD